MEINNSGHILLTVREINRLQQSFTREQDPVFWDELETARLEALKVRGKLLEGVIKI
jgi:hypothetical protein